MPNSKISNDEARALKDRWLRNDESLTMAERVFVLEKMMRRMLLLQKIKKKED